jgi:methyltransferase (TIGR00027 family)
MGKDTGSQSAELTAAIRATHYIHGDRPLVFEDPFAIDLLSLGLREICLGGTAFTQSSGAAIVLGRARYTEELLNAALLSGVDQYVILGAGLDTFALRRPDLTAMILRVYEVDHPKTQAWKRGHLAQLGRELPAALEFIPVDLEHETIADALSRSSFRSDQRAFFSLLGTMPYLSREAIFHTLESIAAASAPGSEIVFDYRVAMEFVDPEDVPFVEAGDKASAEAGEPKRSWLNPQTFPDEVCALGLELIESLSPKQLGDRYFDGRSDLLRPTSHQHYAHFRMR